ncbi:hypothetical protein D3C85_1287970 [compost metagenome]
MWKQNFIYTTDSGKQCIATTRAAVVWDNMRKRCNSKAYQKEHPTYQGSEVLFEGFSHFAEWCQAQHGYLNQEISGNYWSIDKELLIFGNKHYSPEACCFLPNALNMVLRKSKYKKTNYPVGVNRNSKSNTYSASYAGIYVGNFKDPVSAHLAWQRAKISYLQSWLSYPLFNDKIRDGLSGLINRMVDDNTNGIIIEY